LPRYREKSKQPKVTPAKETSKPKGIQQTKLSFADTDAQNDHTDLMTPNNKSVLSPIITPATHLFHPLPWTAAP
jgi:hypothetical protein